MHPSQFVAILILVLLVLSFLISIGYAIYVSINGPRPSKKPPQPLSTLNIQRGNVMDRYDIIDMYQREELIKILRFYEATATEKLKVKYVLSDNSIYAWNKVLDMVPHAIEFTENSESAKAMRWLGFIQGALWVADVYTIDELREHSAGFKKCDT